MELPPEYWTAGNGRLNYLNIILIKKKSWARWNILLFGLNEKNDSRRGYWMVVSSFDLLGSLSVLDDAVRCEDKI